MSRCYTTHGVEIPACAGGAWFGIKRGCTCPSPSEQRRIVEPRVAALEDRVTELERKLERLSTTAGAKRGAR